MKVSFLIATPLVVTCSPLVAVQAEPLASLIGAWQLSVVIIDKNANNKIDDDERKDALKEAQDYLRFNPDGTCEFYQHKVPGRYEVKTESSGKQKLVLYDKNNNKENRGIIYSVTKDELIMHSHSSGSTFRIYKRL
jgi:lipocalin-like protein